MFHESNNTKLVSISFLVISLYMRWHIGNIGSIPTLLGTALYVVLLGYIIGCLWNKQRTQNTRNTLDTMVSSLFSDKQALFGTEHIIVSLGATVFTILVNFPALLPALLILFTPHFPLISFIGDYASQFFGSAENDPGGFITMSCYWAMFAFHDAYIGRRIEKYINTYLCLQISK